MLIVVCYNVVCVGDQTLHYTGLYIKVVLQAEAHRSKLYGHV